MSGNVTRKCTLVLTPSLVYAWPNMCIEAISTNMYSLTTCSAEGQLDWHINTAALHYMPSNNMFEV
jgi:hypothetical protein